MAWFFQRRKEYTSLTKRLARYRPKDEKTVGFRKYRACLAVFMLLIGFLWSLAPDRGAFAMGQIMMLISGIYLYYDIRYIIEKDPVDEIIDDLEQQFWDLENRNDTDPRLE